MIRLQYKSDATSSETLPLPIRQYFRNIEKRLVTRKYQYGGTTETVKNTMEMSDLFVHVFSNKPIFVLLNIQNVTDLCDFRYSC